MNIAYLEFAERLERHELVVGLRRPRVDLDALLERYHEELDPLVLDDPEVYAPLELAHVHPPLLVFPLGLEYLRLQPRQVIHPDLVLLPGDRHEYVLRFEDFHELEAPPGDQLVHLALSAAIQEH